jgi:hypothetical protein
VNFLIPVDSSFLETPVSASSSELLISELEDPESSTKEPISESVALTLLSLLMELCIGKDEQDEEVEVEVDMERWVLERVSVRPCTVDAVE